MDDTRQEAEEREQSEIRQMKTSRNGVHRVQRRKKLVLRGHRAGVKT